MKTILVLLVLFFIFSLVNRAGARRGQLPRSSNTSPRQYPDDEIDDRPVAGPWSAGEGSVEASEKDRSLLKGRRVDDGLPEDRPVAGPWGGPKPLPEQAAGPPRPSAETREKEKTKAVPRSRYRERDTVGGRIRDINRNDRKEGKGAVSHLPPTERDLSSDRAAANANMRSCVQPRSGACADIQRLLSPDNLAAAVVLSDVLGRRGGRRAIINRK